MWSLARTSIWIACLFLPAMAAGPALPLHFVPNRGQWPAAIQMVGRSGRILLLLRSSGVTMSDGAAAIDMQWSSSAQPRRIEGRRLLPGEENEFLGNDPQLWRAHLPLYRQALVRSVIPGGDLIFYAHDDRTSRSASSLRPSLPQWFEFDLRLRAGIEPEAIRLRFPDAQLRLEAGRLVVRSRQMALRFGAPRARQPGSSSATVACRYRIAAASTISFACDRRDPAHPLIIDPVVTGSRYLGGSGNDAATAAAVDAAGNIYVAGTTTSSDLPGAHASHGLGDVFVAKLDPTGQNILFITELGGSNEDDGSGIALAKDGSIFLTGATLSSNFPVTPGVVQPALGGNYDAFVTHLSADGSQILYSTYLGGTNVDRANAIAVDPPGDAIVAGYTLSADFPVLQPLQPTYAGGARDAFVTSLSPDGKSLNASTWMGGSGDDVAFAVATDTNHHILVAGSTTSTNFPVTSGAMQTAFAGGNCQGAPCAAAFLTTLSADGSAPGWSSYLSGAGSTVLYGVAVDATGDIWTAGATTASNLPVPTDGYQPHAPAATCGSQLCHHGFVLRWKPDGSSLAAGTWLSGSQDDFLTALAVEPELDQVIVAGQSTSPDFPVTPNPPQGNRSGFEDAVAAILDTALQHLKLGTYWGGSSTTQATAVGANASGVIAIVGETGSFDLPVSVAGAQAAYQGSDDAFLLMMNFAPILTISPTSLDFGPQRLGTTSAPQEITLGNAGISPLHLADVKTQGDYSTSSNCGTVLVSGQTCSLQVVFQPTARGQRDGSITFTDNAVGNPQTIALTGRGIASIAQLSPTQLNFSSFDVGTSSAVQTITLTNTGDAALDITAISSSSDYAETNQCGAAVPPAGYCGIQVVFTPTAAGARDGFIRVADDAGDSPQTAALHGIGMDFSIAVTPSSQSIPPGQEAQYTLTLTPLNGFQQAVNLACSGAPATVLCTVKPTTLPLDGLHPATAMATVTTTASSWFVRRTMPSPLPPAAMESLLLLLVIATMARERRTARRPFRLAGTALWLALLLAGCGGGGGGGGGAGGGPAHSGTPAGNYSLTITAAAGKLQHTATIHLQVP